MCISDPRAGHRHHQGHRVRADRLGHAPPRPAGCYNNSSRNDSNDTANDDNINNNVNNDSISNDSSSNSEGGMTRLETLVELKLFDVIFPSCSILLKLDDATSVERFEPTVSRSTVPLPLYYDTTIYYHITCTTYTYIHVYIYIYIYSMHIYNYIYTHNVYVYKYIYIYTYVYVYTYVCIPPLRRERAPREAPLPGHREHGGNIIL